MSFVHHLAFLFQIATSSSGAPHKKLPSFSPETYNDKTRQEPIFMLENTGKKRHDRRENDEMAGASLEQTP